MKWLWVDGRRFLPLVYGRSGMVTSSEQTTRPGNAGFVMDPCLDQRQLIKLHLPASYIKYQSCEPAFRHAETFRFRRLITLYLCWAATSRSYFHRSQVPRIARILSLWHCDGSSARMIFSRCGFALFFSFRRRLMSVDTTPLDKGIGTLWIVIQYRKQDPLSVYRIAFHSSGGEIFRLILALNWHQSYNRGNAKSLSTCKKALPTCTTRASLVLAFVYNFPHIVINFPRPTRFFVDCRPAQRQERSFPILISCSTLGPNL